MDKLGKQWVSVPWKTVLKMLSQVSISLKYHNHKHKDKSFLTEHLAMIVNAYTFSNHLISISFHLHNISVKQR